ncbi:MAG TPA: YihY/virulence factor BrkB family protein [Actinomycetaceae bacterium]|nr:YihY/virulence factor BrkB family protein [Actinomycetaceae bacterium]
MSSKAPTVELKRPPGQKPERGARPGEGITTHPAGLQRVSVATMDAVEKRKLPEMLREAEGLPGKGKAAFAWLQSTRLFRAHMRIVQTRGNLLAGGVAYNALFSLFAILTVGITFVMLAFASNPGFRDAAIEGISDAVPGIINTGDGGLIEPESLMLDTALNPTTIIAVVVALWSAKAMMTALRRSLRAVAGISALRENPAIQALRDVSGLLVLGLSVIVTSALVLSAQAFGSQLLDLMYIDGPVVGTVLRVSAYVITYIVDFGVFIYMFRFLGGIRAPRRDVLIGAAIGGLASGIIRVAGTAIISVPADPLMATATAVVTLLLLVNIMVRVVLYVVAIMVNPPAPVIPQAPQEVRFKSRPNYVTVSNPATLTWGHDPSSGTLIPDPTLNPKYEPEVEPEPTPKWGGLIGRMKRRRIARLEQKLQAARDSYHT